MSEQQEPTTTATEVVRVPWSVVANASPMMRREGNLLRPPEWTDQFIGKHHPTIPWLRCHKIVKLERVTLFSSDDAELTLEYVPEQSQWSASVNLGADRDKVVLLLHCLVCGGNFKADDVKDGCCPNCHKKQGDA